MDNNWLLSQLNQLISPGQSPPTGIADDALRNESSLSFPISGSALHQSLEAWANVAFDFDSNSPASSNSDLQAAVGQSYGIDNYQQHPSSLGFESVLGANSPPTVNPASTRADPYLPTSLSSPAHLLALPPFPFPPPAVGLLTPSNSAETPSPATTSKRPPLSKATSSKRKLSIADEVGEEELNALEVEEDKRRRNTAASARFRIKKKQRDAALESTAKELRDRVGALEMEVESLKMENGWLRGLIVGKEESERKAKEEAAAAAKLKTEA